MKPLGFFEAVKFAAKSDGPFSFHSMTYMISDRRTCVWSDEDFDFVLFSEVL